MSRRPAQILCASVALAGASIVSGCMSTGPTMDQKFCSELQTWVDSGPRTGSSARYMRLAAFRGSEDEIIMWGIATDAGCEEDTDCRDEADKQFVGEVAPMTHYWWINQFAEAASVCLRGNPRIGKIDLLDDEAGLRESIASRNGARIVISWDRTDCDFEGCTTFELDYR